MSPSANISKSPSKSVATASHTKPTTTVVSSTPSSSKYKAAESGSGATPSSTTTVKKTLPGSSGAPASSSSQPSSPSTASTSQSSPYQPPQKKIRPPVKAAARRKAATPSSAASSPQPSTRRSTRASGPKGPFVRLATPSTDHRVQIQEQKSPKSTRESRERAESRRTTRTRSTTAPSESESSDSESESESGKSTPEPLSISAVIPGIETKNSTKTKKVKDTDVEMTGPPESVSTAPKPSSATRKATPPRLTSSIHPSSSTTEPPPTKHAEGAEETEDGEKPWLHPSELPYIQRSDWTQDATITYLVQNVFSIPKRIKGGKIAQTQREKGGMAGSMSFVRVESGFPSDSGTTTVGGVVGGTMEGTPPLEGGATSTNATATSKSTSTQASTTSATTTRVTYLPRGYRIPLMFVAKFQWESLRLVLTSERPEGEWDEFKYDIVHLSRLCSHLLKDAQAAAALPPIDDGAGEWTKEGDVEVRNSAGKGGYKDERIGQMTKQWRCPMFDRALTRFFRKWMICREWSVKYFWEEYGEEEYEFDVLKHDWARWVLKGHKGFLLTKDEVELGISADQFLAGLDRITDSNGQGRWVWDNERYVGARGLAVTGGSTNNSTNNTPKGTPSGRRRANQKKDGGKEKGKDKGGDGDDDMEDEVKVKKEMIEANLSRDPSEYSSMLSASVTPTPTDSAPPTKTTETTASSTTAPTVTNAKNMSPPSPQHTSTLPPRFAASKSSTSIAAKPTNTTSTTKATVAVDAVNASNIPKTPSVLAKPNPPPAVSSGSSAKTTTGGDRTAHKVVSPALTTAKTNTPTIPTLKPGMVYNTTISVTNWKKRAREEEEVAVSKRAKATKAAGADGDADADGKAVEVEKGAKEKGTEKAEEKGKEKEKEKGGDAMDVDQPESSVTKKAPSLPAKSAAATSLSTTKAASSLKWTANSHPIVPAPSTSAAPVTSPTTSNASPNAPANADPTLAAVASGSTGSSAQSKSSEGVASSGSASAPYPASLSAPRDDMGLMTWKRPIDLFSLNRGMALPMGTTIPKQTPARQPPVPSILTRTGVFPAPLVTGTPPWRASAPSSAVPPPSNTTPPTTSAPASESSSASSSSSASPIPSSTASDPNVSPYLKFVKDLSSAIDTRLDGAVEKIVEEVRKIERDVGAQTPTSGNGKAKQAQQPPALASPPEMKQALEALLGLLEFNTRLRELVVSGNERALAEIGGLAQGQQKASVQGQKVEAVVEATWGVVNYVETLLREVKDLQKDMGDAHSSEVAKGVGRDKAIGELSAKLDGLERVVGEFRAESVARSQEVEGRAARAELNSEHRDNALSKQVDALKGVLEKVEQRRLEAEDRAEEIDTLREEAHKRRDQLRNEEAKKIHEDVREGIAVAQESRKAVEELQGEIRMRNAVGVNANVQGKERVTVAKIVSDVAIQVEPVDVDMGDAPAERRRKQILSSKAKKALDVVQHMADLPGFSYPLDDDADDIQSSDDGVVAIRTRAVSTKGKEREVARPPAPSRNAATQEHSESTMLALLLDEFRLIKDKLNAMERRSREEVASTKLLHSAELDTLRSEMERRDEDDRRRRELEARLERERLDREMQRLDRLERERCEIREREARERRELVERVERLERQRAERVGESERERERERKASAWTEDNGASSSSKAYRDHLHGYDLDAENAELRRRLAFYESRPSVQPSVPHLPRRESSSGSLSNSGLPHRDLSEPLYAPDPPRRDRSSSIASSSNNVESAKRPPMINTNVGGSSMMDVDGAGGNLSVPAKAQRKMMRRDHGHMLPPSGEP